MSPEMMCDLLVDCCRPSSTAKNGEKQPLADLSPQNLEAQTMYEHKIGNNLLSGKKEGFLKRKVREPFPALVP